VTRPLPPVEPDRVSEILAELVAIDSVNPGLPGGAAGEAAMAAHLAGFCERLGMEAELSEVLPGRPNVLARLPAADPGPVLLIEGHTDTVTLENMPDGLTPRLQGGRLHGRGACDTKGGIAAALHALELLAAHPHLPRAAVHLLGAADEEVAYRGVLHYLDEGGTADAAIVLEPTGLAPVVATKGCVRLRVGTTGQTAHTSQPENGRNAITDMTRVIAALERWAATRGPAHPLCGPPTLTISRIGGGTQVNIVPASCWIDLDYRTLPGDDPDEVIAAIEAVLADLCTAGDVAAAEIEAVLVTDLGLDTAPSEPIANAVAEACRATGLDPALIGVPYGSDASKLSVRGGIPSVVLGPGDIAQAHADDEWVDLTQVARAAEVYLRCAVALGRSAPSP
jgi:acetylornithine deacetylase/succinyl-diaminopimelate desuccinylase-like protein